MISMHTTQCETKRRRPLTALLYFGSQLPALLPRRSTKKAAISRQYAIVRVETTRANVDRTIQNLRRYLDVDASDMAPAAPESVARIMPLGR